MTAVDYGRTLAGLSLNFIVREIARSLPFYTEVLGFRVLYSDPDFAALERDGARVQLHADHTYEAMPWAPALATNTPRGLGAELRILGLEPDEAARAASEHDYRVLLGPRVREAHGWREVYLADPDGYVAVGVGVG